MSDLGEVLRQAFVDAARLREARVVKTARQWGELGRLDTEAQAQAEPAETERKATYMGRVETEERRLMERDGSQRLGLDPYGFRQPKLDWAARRLQSRRNVRSEDARDRLGEADRHSDARAEFLKRCRACNRLKGLLRDEFNGGPPQVKARRRMS